MNATVKMGLVHEGRPREIMGHCHLHDQDNIFMKQENLLWRQK
jgi:hypothetical protein